MTRERAVAAVPSGHPCQPVEAVTMSTLLDPLPTGSLAADAVGAEDFVANLDALLGDHVLPLRFSPGTGDEPYLLAVDASGHPVVVEAAAVLDEATILRGLRFAGRAARMSTEELARTYPGGPQRYLAHLAAFRLTVPVARLLSTHVREGARLILACTAIAPEAAGAIDFLLQHVQVEVLRLRSRAVGGVTEVVAESIARTPPRRTVPDVPRRGTPAAEAAAAASAGWGTAAR